VVFRHGAILSANRPYEKTRDFKVFRTLKIPPVVSFSEVAGVTALEVMGALYTGTGELANERKFRHSRSFLL